MTEKSTIPDREPDGYFLDVPYWKENGGAVMVLSLKDREDKIVIAWTNSFSKNMFINGYISIAKKLIEIYGVTKKI